MKRAGMKDKWKFKEVELTADEIIELNDGLEFFYNDLLHHRDRLSDISEPTESQKELLKQFQEQISRVNILMWKITQAEEEIG